MKNYIKEVKSYAKELYADESGLEFIEIAIGVALVAGLITVLGGLFYIIKSKIAASSDDVDNMDTNLDTYAPTGGSNNGNVGPNGSGTSN